MEIPLEEVTALAAVANTVFVALTVGVYIWIGWITKRYASTTERILGATEMAAESARTAAFGSAWIWAAERLSQPWRVEQRRVVMHDVRRYSGPLDQMPKRLRSAFDETCRTYDLIGIAGLNGMLPLEVIAREWGNSIIRCHEACEPFLNERRSERGEMFWDNFSELYHVACRVWGDGGAGHSRPHFSRAVAEASRSGTPHVAQSTNSSASRHARLDGGRGRGGAM